MAAACTSAFAQIYRCPDGHSVVLQQTPCPGLGQSGGRLLVLPNGRQGPVQVQVQMPAPVPVPVLTSASGSASPSASASASDMPKVGRVLGRTPLPSSAVARKPN